MTDQPTAGVALKLTSSQRSLLQQMQKYPNSPSRNITNPTATALEKMGLVTWDFSGDARLGRWALTEAGKAQQ